MKKSCQSCKFWSPVDPSLDRGWRIFGTCTKPVQYEALYEDVARRASWKDSEIKPALKSRLEAEGFVLQVTEPGVTVHLRTGMNHYCSEHQARVPAPQEASLTGGSGS